MSRIPEGDLRRITASAALMSSNMDGEALGATRAVCRLLGKHDLTIGKVLEAALGSLPSAAPPTSPSSSNFSRPNPRPYEFDLRTKHQAWVKACLANRQLLNEREIDFLESILDRCGLTERQNAWLDAIKMKVGRLRQ